MSSLVSPAPGGFGELLRQRYVSLTSFRRSGAEVSTPLWVVALDGHLYARTDASSGKVKRIRRQPQVQLAACTRSGTETSPRVDALAAAHPPSAHPAVFPALDHKYGLLSRVLGLLTRLRRREVVILELQPRQP